MPLIVLDTRVFRNPCLSGHIREHHFNYGEAAADKTKVPNLWISGDPVPRTWSFALHPGTPSNEE